MIHKTNVQNESFCAQKATPTHCDLLTCRHILSDFLLQSWQSAPAHMCSTGKNEMFWSIKKSLWLTAYHWEERCVSLCASLQYHYCTIRLNLQARMYKRAPHVLVENSIATFFDCGVLAKNIWRADCKVCSQRSPRGRRIVRCYAMGYGHRHTYSTLVRQSPSFMWAVWYLSVISAVSSQVLRSSDQHSGSASQRLIAQFNYAGMTSTPTASEILLFSATES